MEALWIWRQFPRQIASDLSQYHHRRIAEWHSGTLGSYELLELLEYMPEQGAFKTAARGGEYTEQDLVWRQMATEMSKLRSITQTVHGGKPTDVWAFPSKTEQLKTAEEKAEMEESREAFYSFADRSSNFGRQAG